MSLQARMSSSDNRLYNVNRDVAHNFTQVMSLVAGRLEDQQWVELSEVLARENVSMDDLGNACGCYCTYLASAATKPELSMHDSIEASGFFACKPAAQVAVLAMIGTAYAGIQFAGVRDASISVGGKVDGPLASLEQLLEYADRFRRYAGMSRWQRRLLHLRSRITNAFAAFRKS
jgi:hypothetical protein